MTSEERQATAAVLTGGRPTSIDLVDMLYQQAPHVALYAPLCKLKPTLTRCQYLVSTDGQRLSALVAYQAGAIEFTWSLAGRGETLRNLIAQARRRMGALSFLPVLETGRRSWSQLVQLPVLGRYFRVVLREFPAVDAALPASFVIEALDPAQHLSEAAALMNAAYPSLQHLVSPNRLEHVTQQAYYFPEGWFFLQHAASGRRIGCALGGLCDETGEGFIEWVQVLPQYRHRGLGAALVRELIRRLAPRARFITAAGNLDAPFALGGLYKECGFEQIRQWTLLGEPAVAAHRQNVFLIPPGASRR